MIVLVCLATAYTLAFILDRVTSSVMGYEALDHPTPAFHMVALLIWSVLLLSAKFTRKAAVMRGTVLSLSILAILIGCGALAGLFKSIVFFTAGYHPAEPSIPGLILHWLILIMLLFLIRNYLKYGNFAKHIGSFAAVIRVLESIAKGDYKVRLEDRIKGNEPFAHLVNSVNHMAADLEQLENMRQEFISNVSHEIRSPLASIRGFAQVLQGSSPMSAEERTQYLSIIEAESARLSKLSDNLLQLALLESESMRLELRPYRLDIQIRNLILACEPQWRSKRIVMEAFLEETAVTADEDRMSQVWINLIHNSIKFTPEGGEIKVMLHPRGDSIDVQIADTGIGIAEEDQNRVFERFYKADKSRDRSNQGSGLGLSIANKIVGLHGGRIRVHSRPGAGATFTVTLPTSVKPNYW